MYTYVRVQSFFVYTYVCVEPFLCTLMCVYSHFCVHLCACTVIFVHTNVRVQSFLFTLSVYSHFCDLSRHVQSFLCTLMFVYSHFCVHSCAFTFIFLHSCACTVIFVYTLVHVQSFLCTHKNNKKTTILFCQIKLRKNYSRI